jgi:hypothetical protein
MVDKKQFEKALQMTKEKSLMKEKEEPLQTVDVFKQIKKPIKKIPEKVIEKIPEKKKSIAQNLIENSIKKKIEKQKEELEIKEPLIKKDMIIEEKRFTQTMIHPLSPFYIWYDSLKEAVILIGAFKNRLLFQFKKQEIVENQIET